MPPGMHQSNSAVALQSRVWTAGARPSALEVRNVKQPDMPRSPSIRYQERAIPERTAFVIRD